MGYFNLKIKVFNSVFFKKPLIFLKKGIMLDFFLENRFSDNTLSHLFFYTCNREIQTKKYI
jgi:hypothetical protein